MEIIKKSDKKITNVVPNFAIESNEFINVIEQIFGAEDQWKLTVGRETDPVCYRFIDVEDMRANRTLISTPFRLESPNLNLWTQGLEAFVSFDLDAEHKAKSLLAILGEYRPWYRYVFQYWVGAFLMAPVLGIIAKYFDSNLSNTWEIAKYGLLAVAIVSVPTSYLQIKLDRPRIYYSSRITFWTRNQDKIAVGLIVALAVVLAKWLLDG